MDKSNDKDLRLGISIFVIGIVSYFVYKKFFKSKDQKECEKKGGIWNSETKSCDLSSTQQIIPNDNIINPVKPTPNKIIKTGKPNIDLIIDRLANIGKTAKIYKSKNGKFFLELVEPLVPVGKDNKIQFYENNNFWYGTKKGKTISKGLYADGGRKLSVITGKNKGVNASTNSLYDTINKI